MTKKMTAAEKRQRKAERITAKEREASPLFAFAGLVPETTAADVAFRDQRKASQGVEHVHRIIGPGVRALAWVELLAIERYAAEVTGDQFEALRAYQRSTFGDTTGYGYTFWEGVLTGTKRVVYDWRRVEDTTKTCGFRVEEAGAFPPAGWTAPLTRDQFWERFPFKEPELGPDDPQGLFNQTIGALNQRTP